jgi:TolB-like protein/lipoprotein NlpI
MLYALYSMLHSHFIDYHCIFQHNTLLLYIYTNPMKIWSAEIKELEILHSSVKDHFPDLEKEMERLISAHDENMVLLYSRRCLEVIITDLCENELKRPRKTEPLKGIIDKLNQEEKVPSYIIASMHSLNSLSTFGAHPKEFDPEQVKPVLLNLTTVIKWYLKYKTEKGEGKEWYKVQGAGDKVQEGYKGSRIQGFKGEEVQGTGEKVHGAGYKVQGNEGQDGKSAETGTNLKDYRETGHISKTLKKPTFIISGILIVAFVLYIVLDQFHIFRKDKFQDIRDPEGKISIAVMPFENLTGDTTMNWFQKGISSLIINGLGNSPELAVLDDQTLYEAMDGIDQVFTAGISPSMAKEVAKKVNAETYISGSFQGREETYWVLVNLVKTESGEIIWTNKIEGNLKSSGYLDLADSLCNEIKNHLEIKALENVADYEFREAYPKSAEAYRYFIEGMNSVLNTNYESGIQSLKKAVEIDSTFTFASFYLAYAYNQLSSPEQDLWIKKAYFNKNRIPAKYQLWVDMWYACGGKSVKDVSRYCDLLAESGINTRLFWSDIAITYCDFTGEYEKAIPAFEKVMEINQERGADWKFYLFYDRFLMALHETGNHEREKVISKIGLNAVPEYSNWIFYRMAICALSQGKMKEADEILIRYKAKHKELGTSEATLEYNLGRIYEQANIIDEAEMHFRKSCELNPQNPALMNQLARFLNENDINANEAMDLIQKALTIQPDNMNFLWTKGRSLYKQGKYEEALQVLYQVQKSSGPVWELNNQITEAEQALANQNKSK